MSIYFPGLGLEINPPSTFEIFGLSIHLYGLIIAAGLVLAAVYGMRRAPRFGLTEDHILDGVLWVTPFAIVCARLYYCVFEWQRYAANPLSILYIWEGGLAIYGGVIGAAIGIVVYCRVRHLKIGAVMDVVSLGFLIGQAIGRWGNFFNREAHGGVTDSFLRMGIMDPVTGEYTFYHPTFLYESVWNAAGFVLLHFLSKKRKYDGQIALGYLAWYGFGRMIIEGMRTDSLWWGPFRVSQVLAGLTFVAGAAALIVLHFRPHDPENLFVNQVEARKQS